MKRVLWVAVSSLLASSLALPVARADEAVLRLETGHHTAAIRRVSVDAAGKWLLTASEDRTARLWSLATGKLAHTFRAPIGTGDDGTIYAAALSPNARFVVLSTFVGTATLFVVERATDRVLRKITALPSVGFGVFFSPDGKRMAVTLREGGVLVFDTQSWAAKYSDASYQGATFGADFDRAGRLVAVAQDGAVRLYDASGTAITSVTPAAGQVPHSVRFSPKGDRVAVGFGNSPHVALLSGKDLSALPDLDTHDLPADSNLANVDWAGPNAVVAAGTAPQVRWWSLGGKGGVIAAARPGPGAIFDMAVLPDGGVAWGASDGSWGVLTKKGALRRHDVPVKLSFANERLKIVPDAHSVRFAYEPPAKKLGVFSVTALTLTPGALPDEDWQPPAVTNEHYEVNDWWNAVRPRIDGKRIEGINPDEMMRALAIGAGGGFFILGSDSHLFAFEHNGLKLWEGFVPAPVEGLNIGDGNRLVVASYADGTIRWHRAKDGALLLTLFPLSDRKNWIAWMPSGEYTTSPGAANDVVFVENQGEGELPKTIPAARLAGQFHHPEAVRLALEPTAAEAVQAAPGNAQ